MSKEIVNIVLTPEQAADDLYVKKLLSQNLKVDINSISHFCIIRRSVDARSRNIKVNLAIEAYIGELPKEFHFENRYGDVSKEKEVLIIGAGPAGLFAALKLIELGLKPIIFERGKDVSSRKRDIASIHRNEGVDPDSNYGFGEGGAGAFSDGKLYTRSKKKGDTRRILEIFHFHGAQPEILIDAHPHIGTNVLPGVIKNIRKTIIDSGGEIHFNSKVTGILLKDQCIEGITLSNGVSIKSENIILSTGHSARDIYYLLQEKGIKIEAKNFAVGVRVEHPQKLIDSIQYHCEERGEFLPAASYSYAEQVNGRGVYSFCMCPGGVIVPASTSNNELVVNGMSPSSRGGEYANSGIVTEIRIDDLGEYQKFGEIAGLRFQEDLEQLCFKVAGMGQCAPAQRLSDFLSNKISGSLPESSYHPGLVSSDLHSWMPKFVRDNLKQGLVQIGAKAKGFLSNESIIVGVESRTSSPVRIPRNNETLEHVQVKGLYPCGEGAGYAGGIVSSAIDGERCAEKIVEKLGLRHSE